ncbi:hypothetical protein CPC08DRAFT_246245 [Agrocybe pediades]|nr:hypothetical protein CPC08DRAFT_246245 [Agrocybe pediades]
MCPTLEEPTNAPAPGRIGDQRRDLSPYHFASMEHCLKSSGADESATRVLGRCTLGIINHQSFCVKVDA